FSDGTAQDTDIVAGALVREWWLGNGYLTTLSGAAANVWQGQGNPATGIGTTPAVIDMLTATVKTTTANLTGVSVQNLAGAPFDLQLSGVTVASNPATPTPTPTPTPVCRSNVQQHGAFNGENPGHCDPKPTSSTPTPKKPKVTPVLKTKEASQDETKHDEARQHSDSGHQRD
ncbi:MAG: hypothetical protein M3Z11_04805, partial [Candidatus Dormibacteraeota bacterium]|nr:hypothetical protein [Candidatus Dormibacteraeota bacterium]